MPAKRYSAPPAMQIETNRTYHATIRTNKGDIHLQLNPAEAPNTVNNFVALARDGYYDGVTFHRVVPGFVIQGGDPTGTGAGGPGYQFQDEPVKRRYQAGTVAMANAGPNTNGSQFFITHVVTSHLDGKHTVFGQVSKGQDVVNKIQQGDEIKTVTIAEA